jgi:hypothetical protein
MVSIAGRQPVAEDWAEIARYHSHVVASPVRQRMLSGGKNSYVYSVATPSDGRVIVKFPHLWNRATQGDGEPSRPQARVYGWLWVRPPKEYGWTRRVLGGADLTTPATIFAAGRTDHTRLRYGIFEWIRGVELFARPRLMVQPFRYRLPAGLARAHAEVHSIKSAAFGNDLEERDFSLAQAASSVVGTELNRIAAADPHSPIQVHKIERVADRAMARIPPRACYSLIYGDAQMMMRPRTLGAHVRAFDLDGMHFGDPERDFARLENGLPFFDRSYYTAYECAGGQTLQPQRIFLYLFLVRLINFRRALVSHSASLQQHAQALADAMSSDLGILRCRVV